MKKEKLAKALRKKQRLCCYILDQNDLDSGCRNPAIYEIWDGLTPDDFTDSCAAHLEVMLSDQSHFHIYRIE